MGRGDDSNDLYGGLYSPSQSLALASQRGQDLVNPLTTPANPAIAPVGQPESTVDTNAFNPLLKPAFPIASMSPERQLRWQEVTQQAQKAQADIDSAAINQEIARREDAHKVEIIRQSKEMIGRSSELDPADLKNYPIARAKLARDYPIGAGSEQVQRALKPLDDVYGEGVRVNALYEKQIGETNKTEAQKRLDDARKQVAELGPDAIADFALTQQREGTEAAIQKVTQAASTAEQANIIAQLQNAGMTEDQIRQKYTDPATGNFLFPAAKAEAKVRVNPSLEYNRAVASYSQQLKARKDAGYDPNSAEPNPDWSDQQEQIFQGTAAYVNQTGTRAGIKGFDPAKERAEKEAKAKSDADAAALKAKTDAAAAAATQASIVSRAWDMFTGGPAAAPSSPPVTKPAATPIPGVDYSTLRIDRTTGKKYAVGNKTKASPKGEWVEVQ